MIAENPNRSRRARFGWLMFDWANSVYSLSITTAVFPIYYAGVSAAIARNPVETAAGADPVIPFLGMELKSVSALSISLSIAFVLIALLSPLLSGIADYSGRKRRFMLMFTFMGGLACSSLFFYDADHAWIGLLMYIIAAIGYAGGVIFNDAFLPEVAPPEEYDRMSARGYSMGYIGSVILLILNLLMIQKPGFFFDIQPTIDSLTQQHPELMPDAVQSLAEQEWAPFACKISFLMVGIWWFGFGLISYLFLHENKPAYKPENYLVKGYQEVRKVLGEIRNLPTLKRYLIAFFCYNMALQTVMYMATTFGTTELHMETGQLIISVLIIQLIAIPGAFLFSALSSRIGNFRALLIGIGVWIGVCIGAWFVQDATGFYVVGGVVGLIMGGMQALSRATFSKLLPEDTHDTASYFSFYTITGQLATMTGTLSFGIISQFSGIRESLLALIGFFALGAWLLWRLLPYQPRNKTA